MTIEGPIYHAGRTAENSKRLEKASMLPDPVLSLLRQQRSGVLATNGRAYPYTSLISLVVSEDHKTLWFPTSRQSRKYENLLREPGVSILLDDRKNIEQDIQAASALTVLGRAGEIPLDQRAELDRLFLTRHPALTGFVADPKTALIGVTIEKYILVNRFQEVAEYTG
jgi:heme iron utilization protein